MLYLFRAVIINIKREIPEIEVKSFLIFSYFQIEIISSSLKLIKTSEISIKYNLQQITKATILSQYLFLKFCFIILHVNILTSYTLLTQVKSIEWSCKDIKNCLILNFFYIAHMCFRIVFVITHFFYDVHQTNFAIFYSGC